MKTASLELCKELYELSGWHKTDFYYDADDTVQPWEIALSMHPTKNCAAYDLGYLLRKLPIPDDQVLMLTYQKFNDAWGMSLSYTPATIWNGKPSSVHWGEGKTMEDAACKLAIELFKKGILK